MQPTIDQYRVQLDNYSGPLDLLLYLVRRHEIDLHDIPIAQLTVQYLEHIKQMQQVDVEVVGDFLVMAATLLQIKSAMLLPQIDGQPQDADDPSGASTDSALTDPRFELVQQLLSYKQFKDAAMLLDHRLGQWQQRFPRKPAHNRHPGLDLPDDELLEFDLDDANIMDLSHAFIRMMQSVGQTPAMHEVVYDDTPIALHAQDLVDRLQRDGSISLQEIFVGRSIRSEMIGLFLATLELVRQGQARIAQDQIGDPITIELIPHDEHIQLE